MASSKYSQGGHIYGEEWGADASDELEGTDFSKSCQKKVPPHAVPKEFVAPNDVTCFLGEFGSCPH